MEVCPQTELIAIEAPATVRDGSLEIGKGREAQMIRHMRHGRLPDLRRLSLPSTPGQTHEAYLSLRSVNTLL